MQNCVHRESPIYEVPSHATSEHRNSMLFRRLPVRDDGCRGEVVGILAGIGFAISADYEDLRAKGRIARNGSQFTLNRPTDKAEDGLLKFLAENIVTKSGVATPIAAQCCEQAPAKVRNFSSVEFYPSIQNGMMVNAIVRLRS